MKLLAVMLAVALATSVGCESDEPPSAATYQECFDDRPDNDLAQDKIITCCLDYIVDGVRYACGTTTAECINYLTANLDQTDAGQPEKMTACEMYVDMRPEPAG
jgi:hypothetical protein